MFDETYLEKLPEDPALAGKKICDDFHSWHDAMVGDRLEIEHYEEYLLALAIIQAYAESYGIELEYPELSGDIKDNISRIEYFFNSIRSTFYQRFTEGVFERYKRLFDRKFGRAFLYQFSDGDLQRIQTLVNELRQLITETEEIEDEHRSRLLKRLEKLQSELHKSVSDLDRFWGLLIDGSIVLKKVGENAKPILDRIQEIVNIVWRVQARAEELPSNLPLELPSVKKED